MIGTNLVWVTGMSTRAWMIAAAGIALYAPMAMALTDPTRPPWIASPTRHRADPGLQAILVDGPRRLALIDGRLLGLGARFAGARVVAIHRHSVWLSDGARRRELTLLKGAGVRKTPFWAGGRP